MPNNEINKLPPTTRELAEVLQLARHPIANKTIRTTPLRHFYCQILIAVDELGDNACSTTVHKRLQAIMPSLNEGYVNGAINDLATTGYLRRRPPAKQVQPAAKGRPAIYYRVTPLGRAAIRATVLMLKASMQAKPQVADQPPVLQTGGTTMQTKRVPIHASTTHQPGPTEPTAKPARATGRAYRR